MGRGVHPGGGFLQSLSMPDKLTLFKLVRVLLGSVIVFESVSVYLEDLKLREGRILDIRVDHQGGS